MTQYQNNLGKTIVLSPASRVTKQYGLLGAEGSFASVFDSSSGPDADVSDSQLRIYNIMTYLGGYVPPTLANGHLCILGKIQYGIGGATFEADFDWKIGAQLSIAASFVRIMAAYSETSFSPEFTPPSVNIGAMLASGSRAARSQVTRSYPQLTVSDTETVVFPIPPLAHAVNLFSSDPLFYDPGDVVIRFVGGANNGFSAASTSLSSFQSDGVPFLEALRNEDGVRFPESAKFIEISTATALQDYHVTPCFTLSL